MQRINGGLYSTVVAGGIAILLLTVSSPSAAQSLIAADDAFGVPFGEPLVVEPFGVLDNDTVDGENAGESGAGAEIVADVLHGTLLLASDGAFTYTPDETFDGIDGFVYRASTGAVSDTAAVTLSACLGGPDVFDCWSEPAYLAKAAEHGFAHVAEGFEDGAVWGSARSPETEPFVISRGIRWTSNHPDPPAANEITTGPGPARTGLWGFFDPEHGYATGTPTECDVDVPPVHCLYHDGFTGLREPGGPRLHGVGGYVTGFYGANVGIFLDGAGPLGGGKISAGHRFFGVIDTRPGGFETFSFRELDGKVGQALYIFCDDVLLLTPEPTSAGDRPRGPARARFAPPAPNPMRDVSELRISIPAGSGARLSILALSGRLVRLLEPEFRTDGEHTLVWDGRDDAGREVPSGIYFARLRVAGTGGDESLVRKLVVAR